MGLPVPGLGATGAPIAGTAQNTPHDFLFTQTLMDAITSDPGWNGGEYAAAADVADGLRRHADIWAVMGLTTDFWKTEFWRGIAPVVGDWAGPRSRSSSRTSPGCCSA